LRTSAIVTLAILGGIIGFTAATGFTASTTLRLLVTALTAALAGWIGRRLPFSRLGSSERSLAVLAAVATIGALVCLVRAAIFMADPGEARFSLVPSSRWEVEHSCLTAYFVAAQAAARGENPYDVTLYNAPEDDPSAPRKPRKIGPFRVDVYEYPPPFLALPRLCNLVTTDFLRLRGFWFAFNLAIVVTALLVVAVDLPREAASRALLLSPLVLFAIPTLSGFQKGNIQLTIIAISMLAMWLFERKRHAAGGALLAFATASKLFPGLLVLYLIARRQWRAVAWSLGMGIVLVAVTLLDLGWAPYRDFLAHAPGLLGGQAFPAFRNPSAVAINFSIPGLVFKLKQLGVPGMGFGAARIVGTLSTLVVAWAILRAARHPGDRRTRSLGWLSILVLATLCSPFLPQGYAAFTPLWLLTLLVAVTPWTTKRMLGLLAAWAALNIFWANDWPMDTRAVALLTLLPQALTVAIGVVALRNVSRRLDEHGPKPVAAI
jgi:hypothetical protein